MDFLSAIPVWVQQELFNRMDTNRRNPGIYTRSTYIRMQSHRTCEVDGQTLDGKDFVLCGGQLSPDGKLKGKFNDVYTKFDGEGASWRPMPGINGIQVSTKGAMGSIMSAQVSWTCWTFEQLEVLEKFFMTTGGTTSLEWGWSTPFQYDHATFADVACDALTAIGDTIETGNGNFDGMVGTISTFSWTGRADGGFDCTTNIVTTGGTLSEASINLKPKTTVADGDGTADSVKEDVDSLTIKEYLKNIHLELKTLTKSGDEEGDWKSLKNISYGGDDLTFVSWGWMEDNIISRFYGMTNNKKTMDYRSLIFNKSAAKYESTKCIYPKSEINWRSIDPGVFMFPEHLPRGSSNFEKFKHPSFKETGQIRNLAVNVNAIQSAFENADTVRDGYLNLLSAINSSGCDIWDFQLSIDDYNSCRLLVKDLNYGENPVSKWIDNKSTADNPNGVFFFPAFQKDSIVKTQTLEAKVPSSLAITAMYGSTPEEITGKSGEEADKALGMLYQVGSAKDKCLLGLDTPKDFGLMSASPTEELKAGGAPKAQTTSKGDTDANVSSGTTQAGGANKNATDNNSGGGKDSNTSKEDPPAPTKWQEVPKDERLSGDFEKVMKAEVRKKSQEEIDFLMPLTISLTVDGVGGIRFGNVFSSEYIPEKYKTRSLFMVTAVTHQVGADNWETTFQGTMRASKRSIQNG